MSDSPPAKKTYRLYFHDGHVETRSAYGYTEAGDRVLFHGTADRSDLSAWEYRTLLLMISDDEANRAPDTGEAATPDRPARKRGHPRGSDEAPDPL